MHICLNLTFLVTAAPCWTAATLEVTAAILGAALAPAYPNQQKEEEATENDEEYCEPVCGKKGESKRVDPDVSGHGRLLSTSPLLEMSWGGEEENRRRYFGNKALTENNQLNFFVRIT